MAYPYIPSTGILQQPFAQFRKSFPKHVDAATLKKLSIAPSNEGYVIQTLKFLEIIDKEGKPTDGGVELFTTHSDEEFAAKLEPIVRSAYENLFDLRGDEAWTLDKGALIGYFRQTDRTGEIVGGRQANAFTTLAGLAGKRQADPSRGQRNSNEGTKPSRPRAQSKAKAAQAPVTPAASPSSEEGSGLAKRNYGLTVRVEINLPANGSPEVYDAIFKSLKNNLLTDVSE